MVAPTMNSCEYYKILLGDNECTSWSYYERHGTSLTRRSGWDTCDKKTHLALQAVFPDVDGEETLFQRIRSMEVEVVQRVIYALALDSAPIATSKGVITNLRKGVTINDFLLALRYAKGCRSLSGGKEADHPIVHRDLYKEIRDKRIASEGEPIVFEGWMRPASTTKVPLHVVGGMKPQRMPSPSTRAHA